MIDSVPRILTGVFPFQGAGYGAPQPLDAALAYAVPADKRAQMLYLRAGNSASEMVCLMMMRDGTPMRMFPIGAKGAVHVPLVVVEDLSPDTKLELRLAAPEGCAGSVVVDMGLMEV
ncbi:MAG: hypothetical protein ACRYHQ_32230 [Janthinobacterium lividum]